ncbi:M56 family metallopeptidase [Planctellipticum variicoloris]|uniref:M56 family metallopeptidase n=1 Tax=Planctellipticum variicoloris TaxID=3064265 RepID=UPI003013451D|nr:hypothetical protein SH412_004342 [Planctomycetaceae bacterium SH412]
MFELWLGPFAEALLHFLWQGALIAALAGIGLILLKNPRRRYGLLLVGLAACTMCVPVTGAWLVWRDLRIDSAQLSQDDWLLAEFAAATAIEVSQPAADWTWQRLLVLGWTFGVGLCSLRLLLGGWGVVRLHRGLKPAPESWEISIRRMAGLFGWSRAPRVALSAHVGEPLALLWWRPVVVLPAAWALSIPPAVLESILAHEFAHLYRWDLWINAGQRIVEACLFYHPAVWWMSNRLRLERELICDELAVSRIGQPLQYAQALEYVARSRISRPGVLFAASLGDTHMDLLQRVKRVLGVPTSASPGRWWPAGVAALLVPAGIWMASPGWLPSAIGDDDRKEARDDDDESPEQRKLRELRRELERAHDRIHQQEREIRELREGRDRRPDGPGRSPEDRRPPEGRPDGPDLGGLPPEAREKMQRHMAEMREIMMQHHRGGPGRGPEDRPHPPEHREGMDHAGPPRGPFGGHGGPGREGFHPPREVLAEVMDVVRDLKNEVSELRREVHQLRERPHGDQPPHMRGEGPGRPFQPQMIHRPDGPPRDGQPPAVRERRPDGEGPGRPHQPEFLRRPEGRPEGRGPGRDGPPTVRERGPEERGPDRLRPAPDRPRRPEGEKEDRGKGADVAPERVAPEAAVVNVDQPLEAAPSPETPVADTASDAPASADAPAKSDDK